MSRLSTLSPAAIKAMFSVDSSDILVTLLTLQADSTIGITSNICIADNYNKRLSTTNDQDVIYGITSNSVDYTFLPLEIVLPNDDTSAAPKCSITIHDVTQVLVPKLRQITGPASCTLALVLASTPDTVEIQYSGFKLTNIVYNADTVTASLTIPGLDVEPFPAYSFTPVYFPGLF